MTWFLKRWFLGDRRRPVVRLWALVVPVVVLLAAVPLLRPLRGGGAGEQERLLVASARAVAGRGTMILATDARPLFPFMLERAGGVVVTRATAERIYGGTDAESPGAGLATGPTTSSLARARESRTIDGVVRRGDALYARVPPVFAGLLGGVAWGLERAGVSFTTNPETFAGLLTFFGVTLPVALAAGLLYRMARVFELPRPGRVGLALGCAFAGGWFADAVVLNPRGPAAAALVGALTLVIHLGASRRPRYAVLWMPLAGLAGGISATLEPAAALLLPLLAAAVLVMRHPVRLRLTATLLLCLGAAGPITAHVVASRAVAGDVRFPWVRPAAGPGTISPWLTLTDDAADDDDGPPSASAWLAVGAFVERFAKATIAPAGWVGRYPTLLIGGAGVWLVMRRHWAAGLKLLAGGALAGATVVLLAAAAAPPTAAGTLSAAVFVPAILFWSGAWVRRPHRSAAWVVAGAVTAFSIASTLLAAWAA